MTNEEIQKKHIYQLDFLKLFRLCRELGLVSRCRKMPIQYDNLSNMKSSCRRLLRLVVAHSFPNYDIRGKSYNYELTRSVSDREIMTNAWDHIVLNNDERLVFYGDNIMFHGDMYRLYLNFATRQYDPNDIDYYKTAIEYIKYGKKTKEIIENLSKKIKTETKSLSKKIKDKIDNQEKNTSLEQERFNNALQRLRGQR